MQNSFLSQYVLEPTRGENVLDIVLSSYKYLVADIKYVSHCIVDTRYILPSNKLVKEY